MKEQEIKKETTPKKKYYKPKIGLDNYHKIVNSEKPYLEYKKLITNKNVGSYFMGTGKGFHIYLEKKPNWLHRKCMKLFLGWEWIENNDVKSHKF